MTNARTLATKSMSEGNNHVEIYLINEPHHEETNPLHMRKQKRR